MKEYLSELVCIILGLFIPVFWGLIKTHFRSKQNATDIPEMKESITLLKEKQNEGEKNIALLKQHVETIDKKFDKMDCKIDSIITMLTK
jgi:hypothetical protein